MTTTPTLPQMCNRALDGHLHALRFIADGRPVVSPQAAGSEIRGMRTVLSTLDRWGCIETARVGMKEYQTTITDRGRELLAALEAK